MALAKPDKRVEFEKAQAHERRLEAAALQWGHLDRRAIQRAAMVAASFLLSEAGEHRFADWLLLARPDRAYAVATGVAVHALRIGVSAAWDVLMALHAANPIQAIEDYDANTTFIWSPAPGDLYEGE